MSAHADLRAAYAALGLRYGISVRLPAESGGRFVGYDRMVALRSAELRRPWVALVARDGSSPYLVAGDTRDEVLAHIRPARMGPTGPIDGVDWRRRGAS